MYNCCHLINYDSVENSLTGVSGGNTYVCYVIMEICVS